MPLPAEFQNLRAEPIILLPEGQSPLAWHSRRR
jgi:hypothetical protein